MEARMRNSDSRNCEAAAIIEADRDLPWESISPLTSRGSVWERPATLGSDFGLSSIGQSRVYVIPRGWEDGTKRRFQLPGIYRRRRLGLGIAAYVPRRRPREAISAVGFTHAIRNLLFLLLLLFSHLVCYAFNLLAFHWGKCTAESVYLRREDDNDRTRRS